MGNEKLSKPAIAIKRARGNMRPELAAALFGVSVRKLRRIESGKCNVSQRMLDDLMYEAIMSRGFRMATTKILPRHCDVYAPEVWKDFVQQQS